MALIKPGNIEKIHSVKIFWHILFPYNLEHTYKDNLLLVCGCAVVAKLLSYSTCTQDTHTKCQFQCSGHSRGYSFRTAESIYRRGRMQITLPCPADHIKNLSMCCMNYIITSQIDFWLGDSSIGCHNKIGLINKHRGSPTVSFSKPTYVYQILNRGNFHVIKWCVS